MNDFDIVETENGLTYGVISGNSTVFYIKTGKGGNIYGYMDKYLKMAQTAHEKFGYTVVAVNNPEGFDVKISIKYDVDYIKNHFPKTHEIYAFGHSSGGMMLASFAYKYPKIVRVLAVNAPLMADTRTIKKGTKSFCGEKITLVYGENDPSNGLWQKLFGKSDIITCETVSQADHHFKDMLNEFIELPFKYLLYEC